MLIAFATTSCDFACKAMRERKRFITLKSRLRYDTLTITMDNSFDGAQKELQEGIGLASIRAVAEKYGGGALFETKFEADAHIFMSSVYVNLG